MKNLNVKVVVALLLIGVFSLAACNTEAKKSNTKSKIVESKTTGSNTDDTNQNKYGQVITQYLNLKDALVDDNSEVTSKVSENLLAALENFNLDQFKGEDKSTLVKILNESKDQAAQISNSDIETQRTQFLGLSKNMIELVAITGTSGELFQQYCPMYDNNKGGVWLSAQKEIKNPYFGASMLHCGVVEKEL